jgi:hypothetical protein
MREFVVKIAGTAKIFYGIITIPYSNCIKVIAVDEKHAEHIIRESVSDIENLFIEEIEVKEDFSLRWN